MTYCIGLKTNEGLVFASDSRTNAGLDNYSTHKKMFSFAVGDRCVVILTSGNLSTSQHVFKTIQKDVDAKNPLISLNTCNNFDEILIVLELTDGSKIFFLPLGLASIANGILIYFQNNGSFNETIILKYWHSPLISVGLLAIAFAVILRLLSSQKKDDDSSDINEY